MNLKRRIVFFLLFCCVFCPIFVAKLFFLVEREAGRKGKKEKKVEEQRKRERETR